MLNLTYVLKSSLLASGLCLSFLPLQAADNHSNQNQNPIQNPIESPIQAPIESPSSSVFEQVHPIELNAFRAEAILQLETIFGPLPGEARIFFQDGYASNGPGLMFDHARLFLIVPLPPGHGASPLPYATFFISPQGYRSIGFVGHFEEEKTIAFHAFGGAIAYKDSVDPSAVAFKARVFQNAFPSLLFTGYPQLKIITVEIPANELPSLANVEDQKGLLDQVKNDRDVEYWEDQSEFFPIQYGFAPPQLLEVKGRETIVDVNALRTVSLTQGQPTTIPSWPEPFGEGRKPNPAIKGHPTLEPIDVSIGR